MATFCDKVTYNLSMLHKQIDFGNVLFILLVENVTIVEDVAPKILYHTGDCRCILVAYAINYIMVNIFLVVQIQNH